MCMSYSVVVGQTSRKLQADIEIWGLLRLHLFWGLLTAALEPTAALGLEGCMCGRLSID